MRRLVHISDPHFGRTRPELLEPLVARVNAARADLVAVSGDLTQRARNRQFREARAFLDRLAAPWLAVPGNHDVPLDNLARRLLSPWKRYRRWISWDLEPRFADAEMLVVGVNTVNPLSWQRGRIGRSALARAAAVLRADAAPRVRVVVVHHPFEHLPGDSKAPMRGASRGIAGLAAAGADVVLSGHLHTWRVGPFSAAPAGVGALQVHAGTGLSSRLRGEENDFNVLTLAPDRIEVERVAAPAGAADFETAGISAFVRTEAGWVRETAA
jgi:3',5'-cyclic AMP phosphodiesterase CpdA